MDPHAIEVEVVLALAADTRSLNITLAPGASVADALDQAARSAQFEHVTVAEGPVGIFGRIVARDQVLKHGDRIEIYRPLAADPKIARHERAASKSGRS